MNRLTAASSFAAFSLLAVGAASYAENIIWTYDSSSNIIRYYNVTSSDGNTNYESLVNKSTTNFDSARVFYDQKNKKIYQYETSGNYWQVYDVDAGTWTNETDVGLEGTTDPLPLRPGTALPSQVTTNTNNINNLGSGVAGATALTAALTALPQVSDNAKTSCGVGNGAYSSRYAVSIGCASKLSKRVDINAGGSYVFGGSKNYGGGTLDSTALKAGFVFKLGKITEPTLISMKEKKELQASNIELNEIVKNQNEQIALQNERLEKLERIALALSQSKEKDLASISP